MKITRTTLVLTIAGVVVVGGAIAAAPTVGDMLTPSLASNAGTVADDVEYGVNAAGETYGSPIEGTVPTLIPALADEGGFGYVRVSELDQQRNLARSSINPDATFGVNVYESDGVTVIGTLAVTVDTPGPRDGFNN